MASRTKFRHLQFEQCEKRLCMAVTAAVASNGDLQISGTSAGPVEIVALDADSFEVMEGGVLVANVDSVTRGIQITLGSGNDVVTLDLGNHNVNKDIRVNLGEGDNSFFVWQWISLGLLRHD